MGPTVAAVATKTSTVFSWLESLPGWASLAVFLLTTAFAALVILKFFSLLESPKSSKGAWSFLSFILTGKRAGPIAPGENPSKSKAQQALPLNVPSLSQHTSCPNASVVLKLIHDYDKFFYWKHEIEFTRILSDQMAEVEVQVTNVRTMLISGFTAYLRVMFGPEYNTYDSQENRIFAGAVNLAMERTLAYFRTRLRENHLSTKTEADFASYKELHIKSILSILDNSIEDLYPITGLSVSQADLMKAVEVPKLKSMESFEDVFDRARSIVGEYSKEIALKQKEMDDEYFAVFGVHPEKRF